MRLRLATVKVLNSYDCKINRNSSGQGAIADRLCLMRMGKQMQEDDRIRLATEASYLYAPLAHRLGLYTIKSELEDLSLKYTDRKHTDKKHTKRKHTKWDI